MLSFDCQVDSAYNHLIQKVSVRDFYIGLAFGHVYDGMSWLQKLRWVDLPECMMLFSGLGS